ncbi:MAG: HNH endonuclease [Actinomycetota bacterium]|nr:HNH endonuclease [Actinomycetota bacterium]
MYSNEASFEDETIPGELATAPPLAESLPLAELESRLLGLAGHLAAAQCRFLRLLTEFDRRDGWAGPGMRSCAHWLSWRIGMSLRTAVEHVRVAHALELLPATREAFAEGRLSYSKVRAITRIARPDTELELLGLAMAGTTSHVERVVRAARQQGADPVLTNAQRTLSWHWDDHGMLMLRGRLAPAEGAALVAAVEEYAKRADSHFADPGQSDEPPGEVADPVAARRADALHALAAGGAAPASGQRTRVVLHLDEVTRTFRIDGGPAVPQTTAERMACDAEVQLLLSDRGSRLYLGRTHRLASPPQIAALSMRDGRRCQFPGCTHTFHLHAHHVRHWLHGGRTDIDNLILLCSYHHSRVHDNGYRVVPNGGGGFSFLRPDRTAIPPTGEPTRGDADQLIRIHDCTGPHIDPENLTPTWTGEHLDLTPILQRLLPRETSDVRTAA